MVRGVTHLRQGTDANASIRCHVDRCERQTADVDERRRSCDVELDQIDDVGTARQERGVGQCRDCSDRVVRSLRTRIGERAHQVRPAAALTAATILVYAPQRQMLPLMYSRISASERVRPSAIKPTAEHICPGVQ